jgi:hypothetical protein
MLLLTALQRYLMQNRELQVDAVEHGTKRNATKRNASQIEDSPMETPTSFTPWSPSDSDVSLEFTRKRQKRHEGNSDDDVSTAAKPKFETDADL